MPSPYLVPAALLVSLLVMQINQRAASPLLAIVDRWLRWGVFALAGAEVCRELEWLDRPFWVLVVFFFLLWFLAEMLMNWLRVHAFSVSPMPLFQRYDLNQDGDEWPIQARLLKLREWLRARGFKQVQALKAELAPGVHLRISVYQDSEATTRADVAFLPQTSGAITACCTFTSLTTGGARYVTDNLYAPFAGFYPDHWFVERTPWRRSIAKLFARHQARLRASAEPLAPLPEDALADLNATQQELDRVNTDLGFLHSPPQREDLGKITHEGRYRVWKEIWMLNYLGRAMRYE